ncbi:hypothetical protein GCM10025794_33990 [Massilia kyonggiensis]
MHIANQDWFVGIVAIAYDSVNVLVECSALPLVIEDNTGSSYVQSARWGYELR